MVAHLRVEVGHQVDSVLVDYLPQTHPDPWDTSVHRATRHTNDPLAFTVSAQPCCTRTQDDQIGHQMDIVQIASGQVAIVGLAKVSRAC